MSATYQNGLSGFGGYQWCPTLWHHQQLQPLGDVTGGASAVGWSVCIERMGVEVDGGGGEMLGVGGGGGGVGVGGWGWGVGGGWGGGRKERGICLAAVIFLTLAQIQLDALSAVAWSCGVALSLALFISPSLIRYEVVVRPMKPRQPTSMGITRQAWSFFLSKASSIYPSQGTVSSMMMTCFTVSDHITMSGRSCVCTMWCGKWRVSIRSAAIFQSFAAAWNFCPYGLSRWASPSWSILMHGVGCLLATIHCVSVNSANVGSTQLWCHVYIWSELPQDEKTCRRVPLADLHITQVSSPVKLHSLWLAGVGRRL